MIVSWRAPRAVAAAIVILVAVTLGTPKAVALPRLETSQSHDVFHRPHAARNAELVQRLRDAPLELRGVPASSTPIRVADSQGRNKTCSLVPITLDARRQQLLGDEEAEAPETFSQALESLTGACSEFNNGWWTYSWCHREEVRQVRDCEAVEVWRAAGEVV